MTIAKDILAHQETYDFEDLVVMFSPKVHSETVLSKLSAPKYEAKWVFTDGSEVYLYDDVFVGDISWAC